MPDRQFCRRTAEPVPQLVPSEALGQHEHVDTGNRGDLDSRERSLRRLGRAIAVGALVIPSVVLVVWGLETAADVAQLVSIPLAVLAASGIVLWSKDAPTTS